MKMDLTEYQKGCLKTWGGDQSKERAVLGVCGESGEVAETVKKFLRGDFTSDVLKERLINEIGDVLYYVAVTAHEYEINLSAVAMLNLQKLAKRQKNGNINGDGSNR